MRNARVFFFTRFTAFFTGGAVCVFLFVCFSPPSVFRDIEEVGFIFNNKI